MEGAGRVRWVKIMGKLVTLDIILMVDVVDHLQSVKYTIKASFGTMSYSGVKYSIKEHGIIWWFWWGCWR